MTVGVGAVVPRQPLEGGGVLGELLEEGAGGFDADDIFADFGADDPAVGFVAGGVIVTPVIVIADGVIGEFLGVDGDLFVGAGGEGQFLAAFVVEEAAAAVGGFAEEIPFDLKLAGEGGHVAHGDSEFT